MPHPIAKRELMFSIRGTEKRTGITIHISAPFILQPGSVNFEFSGGTAGCTLQIDGLPEEFSHTAYGADSLQALQLASNPDRHLRYLRRKYDFYFPDGEPYFED
ncbi:DUF6968 family protein [Stenotrophomonas terrae]|nr:hypothetical protein [Stenotrophomonas terrae]